MIAVLAASIPAVAWAADGAQEADRPPAATLVVRIDPGAEEAAWVAEALELEIASELRGNERLRIVAGTELDTAQCRGDLRCRLREYADAGVDFALVGSVGGALLDYGLYETPTPIPATGGSIEVGAGSSLIALQQDALRTLRPVLERGGLLDQTQYSTDEVAAGLSAARVPERQAIAIGGTVAAAWLLAPVVFGLVALRRRRWRIGRSPAVWASFALAAASVFVGYSGYLGSTWALSADGSQASVPVPGVHPGVIMLLVGMGWGWLAWDTARVVWPPLHGVERVGHGDLFRLIRQWLMASLRRTAGVALFYLPALGVVWWLSSALHLPREPTVVILVPLCLLAARLWFSTWVGCLAPYIDDHVVAPDANPQWPHEVQRYLAGYLRRTGWDLDPHLLSRITFVPGLTRHEVVSYGGSGVASRIVIDVNLLEATMGEPEPPRIPEDEVKWPTWWAGVVCPGPSHTTVSPRRRLVRRLESRAKETAATPIKRSEADRWSLGQAGTLLGHVKPAPPAELVPLISNNTEDLGVVRELLAEHYPWLAPDPDEEDDDTDPTNLDLLFGALAREIGMIERRDHMLATIRLGVLQWFESAPPRIRSAAERIRRIAHRLFAPPTVAVADAYTALHFAHHHFIQYLAYLEHGEVHHCTARATPGALHRTSERILRDVGKAQHRGNATPTNPAQRMIWLSEFLDTRIRDPRPQRIRVVALVALVLAALTGAGLSVVEVVEYHAVYIERVAEQRGRAQARAVEQPSEDRSPSHGKETKSD